MALFLAFVLVFALVFAAALRAELTIIEDLQALRAKRREIQSASPSVLREVYLERLNAQVRALIVSHFVKGLDWVLLEIVGVVRAFGAAMGAMFSAISKALERPARTARRGVWNFLRRCGQVYIVGARPTLIWSAIPCALYVFIFGPERDKKVDPAQFVAFCAVIGLAVHARSQDKKNGVASGENPAGIGMGPGAAAGYA